MTSALCCSTIMIISDVSYQVRNAFMFLLGQREKFRLDIDTRYSCIILQIPGILDINQAVDCRAILMGFFMRVCQRERGVEEHRLYSSPYRKQSRSKLAFMFDRSAGAHRIPTCLSAAQT